ncbi:MAG: (d)CMP kinase [Clostridia bacterium]|nr:(d)CMP kinase [Clostridia bacterium]MBO4428458.1 (d)CMP kinase [Clostridia bacterium]
MISIAIDGPSGSGKSTLANTLAEKLGFVHLDTGAIYRTVALYVIEKGVSPKDTDGVVDLIGKTDISEIKIEHVGGVQRMILDGEDVTGYIRTSEISAAASTVSAIPAVRTFLLELQRDFARHNNVIMDGRDIGTVILPNATVKFFMTASDDARAERRLAELVEKGENITLEAVKAAMAERDKNDRTRKTAPAVPADDAIMLDNSGAFEDTVAKAMKIIKEKTA